MNTCFNLSPTASTIPGQDQLHFHDVAAEPWALSTKPSPDNDVDLFRAVQPREPGSAPCWAGLGMLGPDAQCPEWKWGS